MVTTNPYSFTELQRWTDQQATTTSRLNIARIEADFLWWMLKYGAGFDSTGALRMRADSEIRMPSENDATLDGYRAIAVALDDPAQIWNLADFRARSRNTSWYAELGHFPLRALIVIATGQDAIHIYDRGSDGDSLSLWMTFENNADDLFRATSPAGIAFLDGRIYTGGNSGHLMLADFAIDTGKRWNASGADLYDGPLSERNDGKAYINYSSSPAILSAAITAVAVIRDPLGSIDAIGRPKHRVAVGTADEASISDAGITAFYDSSISGATDLLRDVCMLPSGQLFFPSNYSTNGLDYWRRYSNVLMISADAWQETGRHDAGQTGSQDLPWSGAFVLTQTAGLEGRSIAEEGSDIAIIASDEGLAISHLNNTSTAKGLTFVLDAVGNHPPYSSTIVDSWAFEDATGLFGKDFTPTGSPDYVAGIIGNCVHTSVGNTLSITGDADFDLGASSDNWHIGFWVKVVGGSGNFQAVWLDNSGDSSWIRIEESSSVWRAYLQHFAAGNDNITSSIAVRDQGWQYLVLQGNDDDGKFELWINGVLHGTSNQAQADGTLGLDELHINAPATGDCYIDDLSIFGGRYLSAKEIQFMYQRGRSAERSSVNSNDALDAADVDYVSADQRSGMIAAGNQTAVVILDPYHIPILEDTSPGGSIQDVPIWTDPGAEDPSYAMVTTTDLEIVQPDIALLSKEGF